MNYPDDFIKNYVSNIFLLLIFYWLQNNHFYRTFQFLTQCIWMGPGSAFAPYTYGQCCPLLAEYRSGDSENS